MYKEHQKSSKKIDLLERPTIVVTLNNKTEVLLGKQNHVESVLEKMYLQLENLSNNNATNLELSFVVRDKNNKLGHFKTEQLDYLNPFEKVNKHVGQHITKILKEKKLLFKVNGFCQINRYDEVIHYRIKPKDDYVQATWFEPKKHFEFIVDIELTCNSKWKTLNSYRFNVDNLPLKEGKRETMRFVKRHERGDWKISYVKDTDGVPGFK